MSNKFAGQRVRAGSGADAPLGRRRAPPGVVGLVTAILVALIWAVVLSSSDFLGFSRAVVFASTAVVTTLWAGHFVPWSHRFRVSARPASVIVCVAVLAGLWFTHRSYDSLMREGDELRRAVEQYRALHGSLPSTLRDIGGRQVPSWYGFWRYFPDDADSSFQLVLGDYQRDGLQFFFDSKVGEWEVNR